MLNEAPYFAIRINTGANKYQNDMPLKIIFFCSWFNFKSNTTTKSEFWKTLKYASCKPFFLLYFQNFCYIFFVVCLCSKKIE